MGELKNRGMRVHSQRNGALGRAGVRGEEVTFWEMRNKLYIPHFQEQDQDCSSPCNSFALLCNSGDPGSVKICIINLLAASHSLPCLSSEAGWPLVYSGGGVQIAEQNNWIYLKVKEY